MRILLGTALLSSSFLLLHCSSGDDDGGGGTGGTGSPSAGKGGSAGSAGSVTAGKGGTGPTGSGGTGPTGSGGTGPTGSGGTGPTGSGGTGPTGSGGTGPTGSGGTGPTGSGGTGPTGSGGTGAGGAAGSAGTGGASGAGAGGAAGSGGSAGFSLTSTTFMDGGDFPAANTCAGADESPALSWTAGPSGTMSYAVVLQDTNNELNHWAIWDIPASVTSLPAALSEMAMPAMPAGAKQRNFQGAGGYFGPCPSGMMHTYRFTVYALSVATLPGTFSSTDDVVEAVMEADLDDASLEGNSDARQAN